MDGTELTGNLYDYAIGGILYYTGYYPEAGAAMSTIERYATADADARQQVADWFGGCRVPISPSTRSGPRFATTPRRLLRTTAVLAVALLGGVPTHGRGLVDFDPATQVEVYGRIDCGSQWTRWSADDGCEGPIVTRLGLMFLAFLVAMIALVVALITTAMTSHRSHSNGRSEARY